ncbi:SGNH/GDSL hydrolase family protein [Streptomyces sp. NPDC005407]|uniref:SGNH/GDSL hydrolase family protein n=1 Tax=Streptomyces sp. NPDC005407 TaxID=3155340 RepID=UPI0033AAAD33
MARRAAIVGGQALSASALLGSLAGTAHADGAGSPGHIRVTVIGDSYTSGEGASAGTYRTVQVTGADGGAIINTIDPAHQSASAPTLQALSQIAKNNPNVTFDVTFVPVSGATRESLYQTTRPGTEFEHSPQIDAVNGADIVIVGIGGNDAGFGDLARTMITSRESTTEAAYPNYLTPLQNGTYLNAQTEVYRDIASRMAEGGTIVTLGYPQVLPNQVPNGSPSPTSEALISSREAQLANEFGTTISSLNQQATQLAADATGANFLYANVTQALAGHELFMPQEGLNGIDLLNPQGSYHPNDLGQALIANVLTPTVNHAVIHELGIQGLVGPPAPDPMPLPVINTPPTANPPMDWPPYEPAPEPPPSDPGAGDPVPEPPPADPGAGEPLPEPPPADPGVGEPVPEPPPADPGVGEPVPEPVPDPVPEACI